MARTEWWRFLLAVLLPPFAVIDLGIGWFFLVLLLTICGWIPGIIAALVVMLTAPDKKQVVDIGPICTDDKDGPIKLRMTPQKGNPVIVNPDDKYKPAVPSNYAVVSPNINQPVSTHPGTLATRPQQPIVTTSGTNQPVIASSASELLSN